MLLSSAPIPNCGILDDIDRSRRQSYIVRCVSVHDGETLLAHFYFMHAWLRGKA